MVGSKALPSFFDVRCRCGPSTRFLQAVPLHVVSRSAKKMWKRASHQEWMSRQQGWYRSPTDASKGAMTWELLPKMEGYQKTALTAVLVNKSRLPRKENSKRKSQEWPKNKTDKAASGLSGEIWCFQNDNRHYYNGHYHFGVTSNGKYLLLANRVSLETLHIPMAKTSFLSIAASGFSSYLCSVILITLRSQAAPRHRAISLHSVCTDFGTQNF